MVLRNIQANGLEAIIQAERLAVVGLAGPPVRFPRRSDVMNAILPDSSDSEDYDLVPTTTLSSIVAGRNLIDLMKLDCEGAEYDILLQAGEADVRKVTEIRMEIHRGPREELIARLMSIGYEIREYMGEDRGAGYLWMIRMA